MDIFQPQVLLPIILFWQDQQINTAQIHCGQSLILPLCKAHQSYIYPVLEAQSHSFYPHTLQLLSI